MDAFYSQAVQQKSLEARLVRRLHVRETGAVGQAVRRGWAGRSGGAVAAPQVIGADDAEAVRIQRLAGADDAVHQPSWFSGFQRDPVPGTSGL